MSQRKLPLIEVGDQLFLGDGAAAFGAVRDVAPGGQPVLRINVEGFGDALVPLDAVVKVVAGRVVVAYDKLPGEVKRALPHLADREDFPPPGEEVELEPASEEPDDADDRSAVESQP